MLRNQVLFVLLVGCIGIAAAVTPAPTQGNLRFQSVAAKVTAPVDPDGEKVKPGDTKPLSTAMQCVMSLLFLYFAVVVIQKTIIFKKDFAELFSKLEADTGVKIPKMPTVGGGDAAAKEPAKEGDAKEGDAKEGDAAEAKGDEGAPVTEAAETAGDDKTAAPAEGSDASSSLLVGGADAALNQSKAAAGWVKDMFSATKMEMVMANMAMVPMFCILVTFARLRARVDLESEPQPLAKLAMVMSTASLFVQILTCLLPNFPEKEGATGCSMSKIWAYVLMLTNIAAMAALYAGIGIICYTIYTLKFQECDRNGCSDTPKVSDNKNAPGLF